MNPNTVAKAYRELEHEGVIELRQGAGAFVSAGTPADADRHDAGGQAVIAAAIVKLRERGLTDEEIRRLFDAHLAGLVGNRSTPWLIRS